MKLRDVISGEVFRGCTNATSEDLDIPQVKPGIILEIRHVAVENRTSNYARLVIGVADGISFLQKEEQDSPLANNIYWTRSKFLIPPGKKLRARLTGCTLLDDLHMTYEGYIWELE